MFFYNFFLVKGNSMTQFLLSLQVDLGFNMSILDIGGGFTGSEFQLKQVSGLLCDNIYVLNKLKS